MPKEIFPQNDIILLFANTVVLSTLEDLSKEFRSQFHIHLEVWRDKTSKKVLKKTYGNYSDCIAATMRMRFRQGFGERYIMFSEARFETPFGVNNCTGFTLKASCNENSSPKRDRLTIQYNTQDWSKWL